MVPRIKKASHRREAVAYRLSLTAAIQSLVMRQRSDPSINLRPYIEKYKAELDEVIAEIARYDKLRNLCLSDDDDDGTVNKRVSPEVADQAARNSPQANAYAEKHQ